MFYFLAFNFSRCDAHPDNLDAGGAQQRTHEKTNFLINAWDLGTLWTDFGICTDVVVSAL